MATAATKRRRAPEQATMPFAQRSTGDAVPAETSEPSPLALRAAPVESAAAVADGPTVVAGIYVMRKEWETPAWLCDRHVDRRRTAGWSVTAGGAKGALVPPYCGDCQVEEQKATTP